MALRGYADARRFEAAEEHVVRCVDCEEETAIYEDGTCRRCGDKRAMNEDARDELEFQHGF